MGTSDKLQQRPLTAAEVVGTVRGCLSLTRSEQTLIVFFDKWMSEIIRIPGILGSKNFARRVTAEDLLAQ